MRSSVLCSTDAVTKTIAAPQTSRSRRAISIPYSVRSSRTSTYQRKLRPVANREIKSLPPVWSKAADRIA
jgi:hypothetical protein